MLSGEHQLTLDSNNRILYPAFFYNLLGENENETVVLTKGSKRNILVFPLTHWAHYVRKLSLIKFKSDIKMKIINDIMSNTYECPMDTSHRFKVPKSLLEYAGIKKKVVMKGYIDRFELWSPDEMEKDEKIDFNDSSFDDTTINELTLSNFLDKNQGYQQFKKTFFYQDMADFVIDDFLAKKRSKSNSIQP